jgi:hypothetical protein
MLIGASDYADWVVMKLTGAGQLHHQFVDVAAGRTFSQD